MDLAGVSFVARNNAAVSKVIRISCKDKVQQQNKYVHFMDCIIKEERNHPVVYSAFIY